MCQMITATLLLSVLASSASAQCPEWESMGGAYPGVDGTIHAMASFDDGRGNALYFADSAAMSFWDGGSLSETAHPASASPQAMVTFDPGTGAELYVGALSNITPQGQSAIPALASWDGVSWKTVGGGLSGSPSSVNALAVWDDGNGPALYVGGWFSGAGGVPASNIARWDGTSWQALGSGTSSRVDALAVHDFGGGPVLVVGGQFHQAGGVGANGVAVWNGASWSALGFGLESNVDTLASVDLGSGPVLFAGGNFTSFLRQWTGSDWIPVGGGVNHWVTALQGFDDGNGTVLYVGGFFSNAGAVAVNNVARWDGSAWSALGQGTSNSVRSLAVHDDGSGPSLFVAGFSQLLGTTVGALGIARWDGAAWHALSKGFDGTTSRLAVHDSGNGPELHVSGTFSIAAGVPARRVARFDGTSWHALGGGLGSPLPISHTDDFVRPLASFDHGNGPMLYAAGGFTQASGVSMNNIARWDGNQWLPLGIGTNHWVFTMATFDDGARPALYVGGFFTSAGGLSNTRGIARWDGLTWSALAGIAPQGSSVLDLAVWDDGNGPALYAAGSFNSAGGIQLFNIGRWDGLAWTPLLDVNGGVIGTIGSVSRLCVFDDGTGSALYAAGAFTQAGALTGVRRLARWDGTQWSDVGGGVDGGIGSMAAYDDGDGMSLYIAGSFSSVGPEGASIPASRVARWDGQSWHALPDGGVDLNPTGSTSVTKLLVADVGQGGELFLTGNFPGVAGMTSRAMARYRSCASFGPAQPYCFGDGSVASCPCGNDVGAGVPEGCRNSTGRGARLVALGTSSEVAGDLVLSASQLPPGTPVILVASQGQNLLPFGDGFLCLSAPVTRFPPCSASPTGKYSVAGALEFLGVQAGQTRTFQTWYRDPSGPCAGGNNLSHALSVTVTP